MYLQRQGYSVMVAEDGAKGVEAFREDAGNIDLVVLDSNMPVMGGLEAMQKIREIRPDTKVIISTGQSEETAKSFLDFGAIGYITKPYSLSHFSQKIRSVFDR